MKTKKCCTCCVDKELVDFSSTSIKCRSCVSEYNREYRKKNHINLSDSQRKYTASHREAAKQRTARWIKDNPEQKRANDKRRYQEKKDLYSRQAHVRHLKNKETNCQRAKQWRIDNPDRVAANIAKQRASKKRAIPMWADMSKVRVFYKEAQMLTESSGVPYQVDHIVPLNSEVVCGLHCEDNLRVITAKENNSKKNKLIEQEF